MPLFRHIPSAKELAQFLRLIEENNLVWVDGVMWMHHERVPHMMEAIRDMGGAKFVFSQFTLPKNEEEFLEENIRASLPIIPAFFR